MVRLVHPTIRLRGGDVTTLPPLPTPSPSGRLQASLPIARHDVSNKASPLAFVACGFFADFEPFLFPLLVSCGGGGGGGGLMSFESSSPMIFRQVGFTPPGSLRQLSACSNSKAALGIPFWSMRSTCPSHFNLRACIVLARGVSLAVFNSSTLGVVVVLLCKMCRRHVFSNDWMDFRSDCLVGQLLQP